MKLIVGKTESEYNDRHTKREPLAWGVVGYTWLAVIAMCAWAYVFDAWVMP